MWCSKVLGDVNPQIIPNNLWIPCFYLQLECQFAICNEREKLRMNKIAHELVSIISFLNFGSEEMPIEEYVQLASEEFVDVENNIAELVDLAWGKEIHLELDSYEESMERHGLDDQPNTNSQASSSL
jgi:hypothetical protein